MPAILRKERSAKLLDRMVFFCLLALIILTAIPYGTVEPWWEALMQCITFALTATWIVEGLISGSWDINGRSLIVPLLALVMFAFLQTVPFGAGHPETGMSAEWRTISVDPYGTRLAAFKLLTLILFGTLLLRYTSNRRRLRALIYVVIGVGVGSAVFGILRQMTQRDGAIFVLPHLLPGRGYGQFINRKWRYANIVFHYLASVFRASGIGEIDKTA